MSNRNSQPKTVLVCGTFDELHPGHRDFFRQAAQLGRVYVIVARAATVQHFKHRSPVETERSRLARVSADSNVFRARLGDHTNLLKPILKLRPDIIALGFDQKTFSPSSLRVELKKRGFTPKIFRLKSFQPNKFKSSILRKR